MSLEYLDKMIADGHGRAVLVGALSTGLVGGGAGTILDLDQPMLAIGVPAGVVLRPIYGKISVQPGIETADSDEVDCYFGVDSLGLWTGDGTKTDENPSNMNSHFDKGSMCRVGSAFTGNMTTTPRNGGAAAVPVVDMELERHSQITNFGDATGISHRSVELLYAPTFPEWLEGPCTVLADFGGTIATVGGFITFRWVEATPNEMRRYAGYE